MVHTPEDAYAALRALPGAAAVLDALADEPAAWIVGGAVRDALRGRSPRELDVVVDGDPEALAERLGAPVRSHDRFGTATVDAAGLRVDLVRARAESYAAPGALPVVRPGTLAEDLARRDFTINAIALRGDADGTVVLRAVDGALDDLEDGRLRVLHDASFRDDPTRLWRLARYAARLGFEPDEHTAALATAADPSTVSGPRLGNELRLALAETDPPAALAAARALNAALLPRALDPHPRALPAALALLPPEGRPDLVTLAAATAAVSLPDLLPWLDAMGFPARDRDTIAIASRAALAAPLHAARTPAQVARAARGAPVEAVALAGGENARAWLEELRHVRLEITGEDLRAAGVPEGPELGERLRRVLDEKLDGTVSGRDAELRAALG